MNFGENSSVGSVILQDHWCDCTWVTDQGKCGAFWGDHSCWPFTWLLFQPWKLSCLLPSSYHKKACMMLWKPISRFPWNVQKFSSSFVERRGLKVKYVVPHLLEEKSVPPALSLAKSNMNVLGSTSFLEKVMSYPSAFLCNFWKHFGGKHVFIQEFW